HRSLPRNRDAAMERLQALITAAATLPRRRIATAPTRASRERRLSDKAHKGRVKATRGTSSRDEGTRRPLTTTAGLHHGGRSRRWPDCTRAAAQDDGRVAT